MTIEKSDIATSDNISIARWALIFLAYLVVMGIPTVMLLSELGRPWSDLFLFPGQFNQPSQQVLKLLVFAIYLSICCTFLPLPTGWIVAAIATREVALAGDMLTTALLVATAGALGSMMANLNDYHLVTLMLRSRRLVGLRDNRFVRCGSGWFAKAPFTLVLVFNIVPIPVDVVRLLAATNRYPIKPFAIANFVGRFIRYGVLAGIAYALNISALWATTIMLLIAAVLTAGRVAPALARQLVGRKRP